MPRTQLAEQPRKTQEAGREQREHPTSGITSSRISVNNVKGFFSYLGSALLVSVCGQFIPSLQKRWMRASPALNALVAYNSSNEKDHVFPIKYVSTVRDQSLAQFRPHAYNWDHTDGVLL